MPDDADISQNRMEDEARLSQLARKAATLPYVGFCYNCNEPCSNRFCDQDCRDDWEARQGAQQRNGR